MNQKRKMSRNECRYKSGTMTYRIVSESLEMQHHNAGQLQILLSLAGPNFLTTATALPHVLCIQDFWLQVGENQVFQLTVRGGVRVRHVQRKVQKRRGSATHVGTGGAGKHICITIPVSRKIKGHGKEERKITHLPFKRPWNNFEISVFRWFDSLPSASRRTLKSS